MFCRIVLPFLLVSLAACQGSRHGSSTDGTYVAPGGIFSVPIPDLAFGTRTDDHFVQDAFTVAFSDDLGSLFRLDGIAVGAAGFPETDDREKALVGFFERLSLPGFQQASPSAAAARVQYFPELLGGALLYRVTIPGGSTLQVEENGGPPRRLDSTRAVLVFCQSGKVVQVSTQAVDLPGSLRPSEEAWQAASASALQFAESIRFKGA